MVYNIVKPIVSKRPGNQVSPKIVPADNTVELRMKIVGSPIHYLNTPTSPKRLLKVFPGVAKATSPKFALKSGLLIKYNKIKLLKNKPSK